MRHVREVLHLALAFHFSTREIARRTRLARDTVSMYLMRAKTLDLSWPLPENWDDATLEERLFPAQATGPTRRTLTEPDWAYIHQELRKKGATLRQLHREYQENHADRGIGYSLFCERHRDYARSLDRSMLQRHEAGDRVFVDFAGATMTLHDLRTGGQQTMQIFVGCLGASGYIYAEAIPSQQLQDWLDVHVRMFEAFGGAPNVIVCDNLKAGVLKPDPHDPEVHPAYDSLARYYGARIEPARIYHPKDKAKVEGMVRHITQSVVFPLRKIIFTHRDELNRAVDAIVERLNATKYQKLDVSRTALFEKLDRPALHPLPAQPFVYAEYRKRRVNPDYHVEVDGHRYSVPHTLVNEAVEVVLTAGMVEINHRGRRVASHPRSHAVGDFTTTLAHRDPRHAFLQDFSADSAFAWAGTVHADVVAFLQASFERTKERQPQFRTYGGVRKLVAAYELPRIAAACRRAVALGEPTVRFLRHALKSGLDRLPEPAVSQATPHPVGEHENNRGSEYYDDQTA